MDVNKWATIAYNYLICTHGYVFEGRGMWKRSGANGSTSGNQNWYAVCGLVGGTPGNYDTISPSLISAFQATISQLRSHGGAAPGINVHLDHVATECPGNLETYVRWGDMEP
ncbi:N-acetylmuramoyl-L-alanine amidase [Streptomyces sp. NPDC056534]|uniref:peptidoglycan recognition protein family protein n=1 Tax=Streptomyces sp. NPDC056534 TaxID=3345857 RepID=UPI003695DA30